MFAFYVLRNLRDGLARQYSGGPDRASSQNKATTPSILILHNGLTYPELAAGTEITIHHLATRLALDGFKVTLVARTRSSDQRTERNGYTVSASRSLYRAIRLALPDDDTVVVLNRSGRWVEEVLGLIRHLPFVIYEHDSNSEIGRFPEAIRNRSTYVANSNFTAAYIARAIQQTCSVVPPIFGLDAYRGVKRTGEAIVFVSLNTLKGCDIAIEIARRRPDRQFIFVESWGSDPQMIEAAGLCPNVQIFSNQPSLLGILPLACLLLMPSRALEAWGRTATEAQICGIPVLASNRGNLQDTIGHGGLTTDPDAPIEEWIANFDLLLSDKYSTFAALAEQRGQEILDYIPVAYQTFLSCILRQSCSEASQRAST
jgi:glycosyltransferase involved in cell wall biosynthesis